jgi:glucose-6-phosphate-specific signal transduction histidine kinase
MKTIFENPTYKRIHKILVFLCVVLFVVDLLGYIPDNFMLGGRLGIVAIIILLPQVVEDWYYWWQKKKHLNPE